MAECYEKVRRNLVFFSFEKALKVNKKFFFLSECRKVDLNGGENRNILFERMERDKMNFVQNIFSTILNLKIPIQLLF